MEMLADMTRYTSQLIKARCLMEKIAMETLSMNISKIAVCLIQKSSV